VFKFLSLVKQFLLVERDSCQGFYIALKDRNCFPWHERDGVVDIVIVDIDIE